MADTNLIKVVKFVGNNKFRPRCFVALMYDDPCGIILEPNSSPHKCLSCPLYKENTMFRTKKV
jgi:hypothetical protein